MCSHTSVYGAFGGNDLHKGDLMFALVADKMLYLKVYPETVASFDRLGLDAFSYRNKRGTLCVMSLRAPGQKH